MHIHQHPLSIFKSSISFIFYFVLLALSINNFFNFNWLLNPFMLVGGSVLIILFNFLTYYYAYFILSQDKITLYRGIFLKQITTIPFKNIQAIQRRQAWYLIPFKITAITIENNTQHEGSIELNFIKDKFAKQLEVARHQAQQTTNNKAIILYPNNNQSVAKTSKFKYQISNDELLTYAITSLGIFPLMGVIGSFYDHFDIILTNKIFNNITNKLPVIAGVFSFFLIFLLACVLFLFKTFTRYYKFSIGRKKHTVKIEQGLFQRNTTHFNLKNVQAINLEQSLLRRFFNLYTINVLLATNTRDDVNNSSNLVLMPVISGRKLAKFFQEVLPEIDYQKIEPQKNTVYWRFFNLYLWYLIWLPSLFFLWQAKFHLLTIGLILLDLIFIIVHAYISNKDLAIEQQIDQLNIMTNTLLTKNIYLIPYRHIQELGQFESILLTGSSYSNLWIDVRNQNSLQRIKLHYLPRKIIHKIQQDFINTIDYH